MKAVKLKTHIPEDRTLSLELPGDVAEGPAEVVVLVSESGVDGRDIFDELPRLRQRLWSRGEIRRHLACDEILRAFVDALRQKLGDHLEQVLLFGSRARGDQRDDSDYDCLAIVDAVTPALKDAIHEVGGDFLCEHGADFFVLPATAERFEAETYNPLFSTIHREGITLWSRGIQSIS